MTGISYTYTDGRSAVRGAPGANPNLCLLEGSLSPASRAAALCATSGTEQSVPLHPLRHSQKPRMHSPRPCAHTSTGAFHRASVGCEQA